MRPRTARQEVWKGRRKVAGPVRAMGEETMWVTASSAVVLVIALAAFAALGGFLLSKTVENEQRSEVRNLNSVLLELGTSMSMFCNTNTGFVV